MASIKNLRINGTTYEIDGGVSSYNDLTDKPEIPTNISDLNNDVGYITSEDIPTVNDGTLTIKTEGNTKGTFTANQSTDITIDITANDLNIPNTFKTIKVNNDTPESIVANIKEDELTLEKGPGVSITTDSTQKKITIGLDDTINAPLVNNGSDDYSYPLIFAIPAIDGSNDRVNLYRTDLFDIYDSDNIERTNKECHISGIGGATYLTVPNIHTSYVHTSHIDCDNIECSYLTNEEEVIVDDKTQTIRTLIKASEDIVGGIKVSSVNTTEVDVNTESNNEGRYYPIELNSNSKAIVNVPWTDTKNTSGATDSSLKLYLIGATSQGANPQTYSHDTTYVGADGCLYSNNELVATNSQISNNLIVNKQFFDYGLALSSGSTGSQICISDSYLYPNSTAGYSYNTWDYSSTTGPIQHNISVGLGDLSGGNIPVIQFLLYECTRSLDMWHNLTYYAASPLGIKNTWLYINCGTSGDSYKVFYKIKRIYYNSSIPILDNNSDDNVSINTGSSFENYYFSGMAKSLGNYAYIKRIPLPLDFGQSTSSYQEGYAVNVQSFQIKISQNAYNKDGVAPAGMIMVEIIQTI